MTRGEDAAVRVVGLRRRFAHPGGDVEVLRGLDLTVCAGELVTVSGRSGSGKSSLLALLGGFDTPDSGSVLLGGRVVDRPVPWQVCALLPQALGLAHELTVEENVALPLRLCGTAENDVEARVGELLETLLVAPLAGRYPAELSFGQQQRVALARAVAVRPRVLLADEPTAHLDTGTTVAALALLRRCADEGSAVVVATHDDDVHAIADRRVCLSEGVLAGPGGAVPGPNAAGQDRGG